MIKFYLWVFKVKKNKGLYDLQKNSYQLVSVPVIILSHPPPLPLIYVNKLEADWQLMLSITVLFARCFV